MLPDLQYYVTRHLRNDEADYRRRIPRDRLPLFSGTLAVSPLLGPCSFQDFGTENHALPLNKPSGAHLEFLGSPVFPGRFDPVRRPAIEALPRPSDLHRSPPAILLLCLVSRGHVIADIADAPESSRAAYRPAVYFRPPRRRLYLII